MIYRVIGESSEWVWSEESGAMELDLLSPGRLMGAFNARLAVGAWGDLPAAALSDPRVRFWFTERGWHAYGLRVAAAARANGRTFRVIRPRYPARKPANASRSESVNTGWMGTRAVEGLWQSSGTFRNG